jgi:hypothetical protein
VGRCGDENSDEDCGYVKDASEGEEGDAGEEGPKGLHRLEVKGNVILSMVRIMCKQVGWRNERALTSCEQKAT